MSESVKLPHPFGIVAPQSDEPGLYSMSDLVNYARAAVALNAPAWRKVSETLPPNKDEDVLTADDRGFRAVLFGSSVNRFPGSYQYWMPIPALPAGPEAVCE